MTEHAMFFVQLMAGPDLDAPRRQAEEFEFDRAEVVDFWSKTMGEHSAFISPPPVPHMRREAVKFIDELKRTQAA